MSYNYTICEKTFDNLADLVISAKKVSPTLPCYEIVIHSLSSCSLLHNLVQWADNLLRLLLSNMGINLSRLDVGMA